MNRKKYISFFILLLCVFYSLANVIEDNCYHYKKLASIVDLKLDSILNILNMIISIYVQDTMKQQTEDSYQEIII